MSASFGRLVSEERLGRLDWTSVSAILVLSHVDDSRSGVATATSGSGPLWRFLATFGIWLLH